MENTARKIEVGRFDKTLAWDPEDPPKPGIIPWFPESPSLSPGTGGGFAAVGLPVCDLPVEEPGGVPAELPPG